MPLQLDVTVVGAGIGGLAAAVALRRAGHRVVVWEEQSEKREVGFAMSISPNALKVLRSLGVDPESARMVHCTEQVIFRATQRPFEVTSRASFADFEKEYGIPWMMVHRVDLHNRLWDLATNKEGAGVPVTILEGRSAVAFDADGSIHLADGTSASADLLVAADGVKSSAHAAVLGEEIPAGFTGSSHVRVCIPTRALTSDPDLADFMALAPTGISSCSGPSRDRKILRYPCSNNELQNFGFYATAAEDLPDAPTSLKALARARLRDFDPSVHRLLDHCKEEDMYLWKVADRDPLPSFHRDRLVVLGDAAHPMLPTLGNGAGMAIEDAGALGVAMTGVVEREEVVGRLKAWDRVRRPRASAVQLLSRSVGGLEYELDERTRGMVREYLGEGELPEFTREAVYRAVFRYDCLGEMRRAMGEEGHQVNGL